ncbi:MAG: Dna2/Cas4 domain-containing protein, partial [Anaerolineae bacterium]
MMHSTPGMLGIVAILVALGLILLWLARRGRVQSGLPEGRLVYTDTGGWHRPERPLCSRRLQLTGKPDYLVESGDHVIPVEAKSGHAPKQPYASHVLQLTTYCLLVEEAYGQRPPYGIIKYADGSLEVDYEPGLEEELLRTVNRMRADLAAGQASRRHNESYR